MASIEIANSPSQASLSSKEPKRTNEYLKKIAKNAGIAGGGNLISQIFGPVIGIITTRALGAELYGIYALATYWTGMLADISRLGFGGMLIRFVAAYKGEGRQDKIKGAILLSLKLVISISGLFTIALLLLAEPFCTHIIKRPDATPVFRFFSFAILFTAIYGTLIAALTGFQQQRYVVISSAIISNFVKLITLVTFLGFGLKIYAALASSLLQDIAILGFGLFFLIKVFPQLKQSQLRPVTEHKTLWKYASTIFANSLFFKYTFRLDLLFLGLHRTVAEVGLYATALKIQPLIFLPSYAIAEIFNPLVAELYTRNEINQIGALYKAITKWTAMLSTPIFLIVVLFHQPILSIFGKEFTKASSALIILALGNLVVDIVGTSGHVINMIGKPMLNLVNSIVTAVISVSLLALLVPAKGMIGAALACSTGIFAVNIIRLIQVYYLLKIHPFKASLLHVLVAGSLSAISFLVLKHYWVTNGEWYFTVLQMLFCCVLYVGCLFSFKFDDEDLIVLRALRQRFAIRKG